VSAHVGGDRRRQHARDGGQRAVERQFASTVKPSKASEGNGANRRHDPEGDWQVVMTAFLGHVGGREIDRDALGRQREPGGVERRVHAFPRFAHRLVGEADEAEHDRAAGEMHLNIHRLGVDPLEGDGCDPDDHDPLQQTKHESLERA